MSRIYEATRRASGRVAAWETTDAQRSETIESFPNELAADVRGTGQTSAGSTSALAVTAPTKSSSSPVEAARVATPLPVDVGGVAGPGSGKLVSVETWSPAFSEYRRLAATLVQADTHGEALTLMVTSSVPGEGKTLTAANLALTMSRSFGRRVLLVDADMRRPFLHTLFGMPNRSGFDACLKAGRFLPDMAIDIDHRLTLLTAGKPDADPVGFLSGPTLQNFVGDVAERFECVIFDTPPAVLLPDAELLSKVVKTTLLVIHSGKTSSRLAERAVEAIGRERIAGVVLNQVRQEHMPRENYAASYGYDHAV
jgi:capsular exopolysaccharide synthesis family protein